MESHSRSAERETIGMSVAPRGGGSPTNERIMIAGNNEAATLVLDLLLDRLPADALLAIAPAEESTPAWQRSLADHARERGVTCLQPEDVNANSTLDRIATHRPTLLLSVYYTQIFSPQLLNLIQGPRLNFHPSLLPRHRGVAPLIWAIVEGDEETAISVHLLDDGIDTGDLVLQLPLAIDPDDTGFTLHRKAARLVRTAAAKLLDRVAAGKGLPEAWPQSGEPSYHPRRAETLNRIDWGWPSERIRNVVRALAPPLPGAYLTIDGKRFILVEVEPAAAEGGSRPPGTVELSERHGSPMVWASDGPLLIRRFLKAEEPVPGRS